MTTLIKISNTECMPTGNEEIISWDYKKVIINGEEYTNTKAVITKLNFINDYEINNSKWRKYDIDVFEQFGLPIYYLLYPERIDPTSITFHMTHYSDRFDINLMMLMYEIGLIDKNVICNLNTGRFERGLYVSFEDHFLKTGKIQIDLFSYGFNSTCRIEMKLNKFLCLDFTKLSNNVKSFLIDNYSGKKNNYSYSDIIFPKYIFEMAAIPDKLKNDIALNITQLKINYKQKTKNKKSW